MASQQRTPQYQCPHDGDDGFYCMGCLIDENERLRAALQKIADTRCADAWPPAFAARELDKLGLLDEHQETR